MPRHRPDLERITWRPHSCGYGDMDGLSGLARSGSNVLGHSVIRVVAITLPLVLNSEADEVLQPVPAVEDAGGQRPRLRRQARLADDLGNGYWIGIAGAADIQRSGAPSDATQMPGSTNTCFPNRCAVMVRRAAISLIIGPWRRWGRGRLGRGCGHGACAGRDDQPGHCYRGGDYISLLQRPSLPLLRPRLIRHAY